MLGGAQSLRAEQRWEEAAGAYQALIGQHPQSAEAHVAQVSLGALQLERLGDPAAAVDSFEAYLDSQPDGVLAQEASFQRAVALQEAGRQEEAVTALEQFLTVYPTSLSAPLARQRLEEIQ